MPSNSTEGHDRGEKFANCHASESLREYLMIDIPARRVELYRKGADGLWVSRPTEMTPADACIDLQSVKLKIDLAMLFAATFAATRH